MRLQSGLPATEWNLARGCGDLNAPKEGAEGLPQGSFLTKDEVLRSRTLHYTPGSIFLGRVDDQLIGIKDNRHIITLAGSRSGKSACVLIPNLLLYPGSVMVIDPKGELAVETALHRKEVLGQEVVILDPFGIVKGEARALVRRHNPLKEILDDTPEGARNLIDDAALVAEALVEQTSQNDSYWSMAARNLVQGLVLATMLHGQDDLPGMRKELMQDEEGLSGLFRYMSAFAEQHSNPLLDENIMAAADAVTRVGRSMIGRIGNTEGAAVLANAIEQLAFLESPGMRDMLSGHDISLRDLKAQPNGPVTLYLVLPAGRVTTHSRWLRLMVSQALSIFEHQPNEPEHPVLLILEEFAALGHLRPVEQAAGFIAGSHVRLWSVLQDLSQLQTHYEKGWETFIGNAGIFQAFSLTDQTSLEYVSKRLGETTVEVVTPQHLSTRSLDAGDPGLKRSFEKVPLLSPSEIGVTFRRLSKNGSAVGGRSLVLWSDSRPFIVDRVWWKHLETAA